MALDLGLTLASAITHNCVIKTYPDGSREFTAAPVALFRERGWEASDDYAAAEDRRHSAIRKQRAEDFEKMFGGGYADAEQTATPDAANLARAKRRARGMLRDYARSNPFVYFVTLTLDASKVDRYDIDAVVRIMRTWLDNRVRRKGLLYVLVPELHKDGAVHFHGFINDALPAIDSGTISRHGGKPRKPRSAKQRAAWLSEGGHIVYNLPDWTLGYTTAIRLYGKRDAAIAYVCKYITKEQQKVGGRWYYSGGALRLPDVSYADVDFEAVAAEHDNFRFTVDALGCEMVRWYEGRENDA